MKVFFTAEVFAPAREALDSVRKEVESVIDAASCIGAVADLADFFFLAVVTPVSMHRIFPEVDRHDAARRAVEFRFHLPFDEFMRGDRSEQLDLFLSALRRAVERVEAYGYRSAANCMRSVLAERYGSVETGG